MEKKRPKARTEVKLQAIKKIENCDGFASMTITGREFNALGDGVDPASLIAMAIHNDAGLLQKVMIRLQELRLHDQIDKSIN